ncbi:hypothetical protein F5882DRAFT_398683, partial [Hyaloscypha sp. PMI_1271]
MSSRRHGLSVCWLSYFRLTYSRAAYVKQMTSLRSGFNYISYTITPLITGDIMLERLIWQHILGLRLLSSYCSRRGL